MVNARVKDGPRLQTLKIPGHVLPDWELLVFGQVYWRFAEGTSLLATSRSACFSFPFDPALSQPDLRSFKALVIIENYTQGRFVVRRIPAMRSLLALSAVALFIFAQPTLAATACDPHAPLNGAFCAGELCSTIGITTYDHDGTTPIACAYDPVFNRNIWKPMSASVGLVGGGSYTAFGTTSCDVFGGYHVSYTGTVVYPVAGYLNHALAIGSVFCSAVAIPAGSSGTGQFSNTVDEAKMVLPCAVCVK